MVTEMENIQLTRSNERSNESINEDLKELRKQLEAERMKKVQVGAGVGPWSLVECTLVGVCRNMAAQAQD